APLLADPSAALVELRQGPDGGPDGGPNDRHDEISFVGGEPALDPRLPELIEQARGLGFSAIGLQTNGQRLAADRPLFDRLVGAGLRDLHLSIHAPTAEAHDY